MGDIVEKLQEIIEKVKQFIFEFYNANPARIKTVIISAAVFVLTAAMFFCIGTNRNISRELVAEKVSADAEYEEILNKTEEQNGKLDEINRQIEEAEAKVEEYNKLIEDYEAEITELDGKIEEKLASARSVGINVTRRSKSISGGSSNSGSAEKAPLTDDSIVYVTATGKKYHRDGCASLSKSKIAITLANALAKGYQPCKTCN